MNGVLAATIGGLVALIFWGVSDWLATRNSKTHAGLEVNLAIHLPAAIILTIIFLISGQSIPGLNQILIIMLAAAFFTAGYILSIKALSIGQAGVVIPLINTYPLFVLLATFLFMGLTFSNLKSPHVNNSFWGSIAWYRKVKHP
ncbi:EamA family transporter [Candidatus Parcubacteria bacterium]|nr:EamA family transporter [Candidatus Parcubacteria bacterium]